MIKPRDPNTFFGAVSDIIELIGAKAAAASVDLAPSSIYQWSEPESGKRPSLMQAVALDRAAAEATGRAPILAVYHEMVGRDARPHVAAEFGDRMMMLVKEIGDIADARRAAMMPSSSGGTAITVTEYCHISREISEAREALDALQRDLDAERESECASAPTRARA